MKRIFTILFLGMSFMVSSQSIVTTPKFVMDDNMVYGLKTNVFKFTVKPNINDDSVRSLLNKSTNQVNGVLDIGGLDMRLKLRLTHNISFINGFLVNSLGGGSYNYNCGVIFKF